MALAEERHYRRNEAEVPGRLRRIFPQEFANPDACATGYEIRHLDTGALPPAVTVCRQDGTPFGPASGQRRSCHHQPAWRSRDAGWRRFLRRGVHRLCELPLQGLGRSVAPAVGDERRYGIGEDVFLPVVHCVENGCGDRFR
jgi:hypothetical protein